MRATAIEDGFKIAVLIPCYNQAETIGGIVRGFREALPAADIFVFDNNSTDDTAREATREGARVYREARQGKGNVVRRMFADIDADIYVLAEGDGSYDPADAPSLVNALVTERVDMVVGTRRGEERLKRQTLSERAFAWLYRRFFAGASIDIVSGYRAFTRRFVKSFPAISNGFDVAVELSMHANQLMIPVAEIDLGSGEPQRVARKRPTGVADAVRAATMLGMLVKETRPFGFYALFATVLWIIGLSLTAPILTARLDGEVLASFSNAFIGMGMFVAGFIMAGCGLVLEALGRSRVEQKRILFLTVPGLGAQ